MLVFENPLVRLGARKVLGAELSSAANRLLLVEVELIILLTERRVPLPWLPSAAVHKASDFLFTSKHPPCTSEPHYPSVLLYCSLAASVFSPQTEEFLQH